MDGIEWRVLCTCIKVKVLIVEVLTTNHGIHIVILEEGIVIVQGTAQLNLSEACDVGISTTGLVRRTLVLLLVRLVEALVLVIVVIQRRVCSEDQLLRDDVQIEAQVISLLACTVCACEARTVVLWVTVTCTPTRSRSAILQIWIPGRTL